MRCPSKAFEAGAENDAAPSPPSPQLSQTEKPVVPPVEEPEDAAGAVFVRGIKQCGDFHVPCGATPFVATPPRGISGALTAPPSPSDARAGRACVRT